MMGGKHPKYVMNIVTFFGVTILSTTTKKHLTVLQFCFFGISLYNRRKHFFCGRATFESHFLRILKEYYRLMTWSGPNKKWLGKEKRNHHGDDDDDCQGRMFLLVLVGGKIPKSFTQKHICIYCIKCPFVPLSYLVKDFFVFIFMYLLHSI